MKILGIDPGTSRIGYGLIETDGGLKLVRHGVIEPNRKSLPEKISRLSVYFRELLAESRPDLAAIEKLFFAKNRKTAMEVAHARGVLLSILLENGVPIVEYAPNEVKAQVAGYGLADKIGVAKMVKIILKINELPGYDDASDALAIAITAASNLRLNSLKPGTHTDRGLTG